LKIGAVETGKVEDVIQTPSTLSLFSFELSPQWSINAVNLDFPPFRSLTSSKSPEKQFESKQNMIESQFDCEDEWRIHEFISKMNETAT
jgi:hypothetical protein